MKRVISFILVLCLLIPLGICGAFAQEEPAEAETEGDEFDFSAEQEKIEELGIPTVASVAEMKANADDLWNNKDYEGAASAYAEYAKQANWLANIITAGLEPYYGASYDDRKDWSPILMSIPELAAAETASNGYKSERNRAMLYEGLCYYHLNDYEMALPLLIKALDLIEIDDETNWSLGMDALFSIVGYQ